MKVETDSGEELVLDFESSVPSEPVFRPKHDPSLPLPSAPTPVPEAAGGGGGVDVKPAATALLPTAADEASLAQSNAELEKALNAQWRKMKRSRFAEI